MLAGATLAAVLFSVGGLQPRAPGIERSSVLSARVEQGPFVVRVRGAGTLRPESIRWLTAESAGRVEEVLVKAGASVSPTTPVLRLENLDLRLLAVQSEREAQAAEALVLAQQRQSKQAELELAAELVGLRASHREARRRAEAYAEMEGSIVSRLDGQAITERVLELEQRESLAQKRLGLLLDMAPRELSSLKEQVRELGRIREVREQLVEHLVVRAAAYGILQDVLVELGQWVVPGAQVAKVIVSRKLQAELRIPAEQAGHISLGQAAQIRTGFGDASESTLTGQVRRIAPAASEGTVDVEVALDGDLPDSVRPDQNIDGVIETERSARTLYVARPVGLPIGDSFSLFRIEEKTQLATRVRVRTGRISVDSIEVLSGLRAGDEVIVSDMSRYAEQAVLRLE